MDRWSGKVAVVTGAASGIGAQMCRDLVAHGVSVVGLDFDEDSLLEFSKEISNHEKYSDNFSTIHCDLTQEDQIQMAFDHVLDTAGGVDILVNCAGIMDHNGILDDEAWERTQRLFQTNILATISCIRKAFKSMSDRDAEGYIVNMCSVTGHAIPAFPGVKPVSSAYYASKYAVNALNRAINQELVYYKKSKIRISNISPGLVNGTNIAKGSALEAALKDEGLLQPKDISNALIYILSQPEHVQIREIILESVGGMMF